ncbi:MAG: PepSY-associated TM helix family [Puniceicoccaceae bacterium 5H]|nr:MAG: PepSY-associated TM helix family [Puniceicoccaceae bacterium 5H]
MSTSTTESSPAAKKPGKSWLAALYPAVWRWHFWMGLIITPILVVVSITGALYVFEDELEALLEPELQQVEVPADGQMRAFSERVAAAQVALPEGWEFSDLSRMSGLDRSDRIVFHQDVEDMDAHETPHRVVFVNPYTAEVLGDRDRDSAFFPVVLEIHRTLLGGSFGRYLVEAGTCWGIVSMLTGLLLWWPRGKARRKAEGVWVPRFNKGLRVALRDLHAIPGLYLSLFVLAIMGTGLLYTQVWGKATFAGLYFSGQLPAPYVSPPKSTELADGATPVGIDRVMAEARSHYAFDQFYLAAPHNPGDCWTVFGNSQDGKLDEGAVYIDASTGDPLASIDYPSLQPGAKAALMFYSIHTGRIFGLPTKILALISCLIIVAMSLTGVWMWWRRHPSGKFGAPRRTRNEAVPKTIVAVIIVLAIFFPLVGLSLILICLISALRWGLGRLRGGSAA